MTTCGTQEPDSEPKSRLKIGNDVVKAKVFSEHIVKRKGAALAYERPFGLHCRLGVDDRPNGPTHDRPNGAIF
jgi:hypothetical protein